MHQASIDLVPAADRPGYLPVPPSSSSGSPSVPQLVTEILRRQGRAGSRSSNPTERAAVGAAISILGACLAEEGVGPLPQLTTGLLEMLLTPDPAVE